MRLDAAAAAALGPELDRLGAGEWLALEPVATTAVSPAARPAPTFDDVVALAGGPRRLRVWSSAGHQLLVVAGLAEVEIDGGGSAAVAAVAPEASPAALAELLLGPVLVLALARRGRWCLHASAAWCGTPEGGGAALFLGESGVGKSTLAAALPLAPAPGGPWRRIADDVTPIAAEPGGAVVALARFPQLKLVAAEGADLPARMPVAAAYVLVEAPATGVSIRRLPPADAALALVRSTVAARLMGPDLLARNVVDAAGFAATVPVSALAYPRRREWLPRVAEALARDLAGAAT